MIFVIDNLKFDASKMELVSRRCQYNYKSTFLIVQLIILVKMSNYLEAKREIGC